MIERTNLSARKAIDTALSGCDTEKERDCAGLPVLQPPHWGEPCNHCGLCCQEEVCEIGLAVFGNASAPCPGLQVRERRYICSLLELASEEMRPFLSFRLGIGAGCDRFLGEE